VNHDQASPSDGPGSPDECVPPDAGGQVIRLYHVCDWCNAKWFSLESSMNCPRCGTASRSTEWLPVPWLRSRFAGEIVHETDRKVPHEC